VTIFVRPSPGSFLSPGHPVLLAALTTILPARLAAAPAIDGRIDDAVWAQVPALTSLTEKQPADGATPVDPTVVRIAYDDANLYVAVDCPQSAPVVARLTRRDREIETDRVEIDLDTRRDGKSAFAFVVSAAGVLADGLRYDDTEISMEWDGVWEAEVARRDGGWSAELRIPLSLLRPADANVQTWGLQVRRHVVARGEIDELAYIPRDEAGEVSRYGEVGPFERLQRPLGLELQPFVLGSVEHQDDGAGDAPGTTPDGSAGLDARLRITRELALDVAVLPDFGQVEADEVVLELSNVETFFPEKRPFFLQGLDLFATPHELLYTRRIGIDAPLWGAAKLTGNVTDATAVGSMVAITGPGDGEAGDPTSAFTANRVRRDLGEQAALGAFVGGVSRRGDARDAAVGGADLWWRSEDSAWSGTVDAYGTRIAGGAAETLPDGIVLDDGATGAGGSVSVAKEGGYVIGELVADAASRRLDLNELGYLDRANVAHVFAAIGIHDTAVGRVLRDHLAQIEVFDRWNLDGLPLGGGLQINSGGTFTNLWEYFVEVHRRPAHFDDREVGDGTALERRGLWGLELELATDERRVLSFGTSSTIQRIDGDGWLVEGDATARAQVLPQLEVELEPSVLYANGEPRHVGDAGAMRLFAEQRAISAAATLRTTYAVTPRLTFQAYGQLFVDAIDHHDYAVAALDDRRVELVDLSPAAPPPEEPDLEEGAFNASVVARWEWRLGSTAYLVYTHAQRRAVDALDGAPRLAPGATLRGPAADVVLLKIAYWWGA
jgi:hypothetical protein